MGAVITESLYIDVKQDFLFKKKKTKKNPVYIKDSATRKRRNGNNTRGLRPGMYIKNRRQVCHNHTDIKHEEREKKAEK